MTEPREFAEPLDEIEALIRSARDYVRPSDDLRPRVLETARAERRERAVQRRFWQLAAVVFLCGLLSSYTAGRSESETARQPAASEPNEIFFQAEAMPRSSDSTWEMVESFYQLRLRQAQLLRL